MHVACIGLVWLHSALNLRLRLAPTPAEGSGICTSTPPAASTMDLGCGTIQEHCPPSAAAAIMEVDDTEVMVDDLRALSACGHV